MEISVIKIYCCRRFLTQVRPSGCEWYFRGVWWGPSQCILTLQMGSVNWLREWGVGWRQGAKQQKVEWCCQARGRIWFHPFWARQRMCSCSGSMGSSKNISCCFFCMTVSICPHGQGVDSLNVMIELDHFCLLLLINWLICWLFKWFQFSNKQVIDQHGGSVVQ